jgi:hypothetical protein
MSLVFKSKLYREEIKHWLLIGALSIWAISATIYGIRTKQTTLLIGIDENGSRLITDTNDRFLKSELKNFINEFISSFYTYNESTFSDQVGKASDLMSKELWELQKSKLLELKAKLAKSPLSQRAEILSIDLVNNDRIEATIGLTIWSRMNEQKVILKVILNVQKAARTETNTWGYEILEVKDEVI